MAKHFTAERRNELAEMIISEGHVTIADAASHFNVSIETIRKDMIYLEQEGIINKTHGGALPSSTILEKPVFQKRTEHQEHKKLIAKKALEYIPENATLFLDSGSTVVALAELLKLKSGLTIFTNNVAAFNTLIGSDNKLFILGGDLHQGPLAIVGKWARDQILSTRADVVFLGTDGLESFQGPTAIMYEEVDIKRAYIASARKSVLLVDSSKFQTSSRFEVASWREIDTVISDEKILERDKGKISRYTEIIIAE
ncbi:MAG: DeoR/GlpR family DNA-binding transcription regulator [Eubacteriales bacterium]|nr:DeoR/GlpR family DNA-binding transcription regulator [Eubacteriales bacterium]